MSVEEIDDTKARQSWFTPDRPILTKEQVDDLAARLTQPDAIHPYNLYSYLVQKNLYLSTNELALLRQYTSPLSSYWMYEHALCARVLDRWNLRPRFGAEGYYFTCPGYAWDHDAPIDGFLIPPHLSINPHPLWGSLGC